MARWKEFATSLADKYDKLQSDMEVQLASNLNLKASNESLLAKVKELEMRIKAGNDEKAVMVKKWSEEAAKLKSSYENRAQ